MNRNSLTTLLAFAFATSSFPAQAAELELSETDDLINKYWHSYADQEK